MFRLSPNDAKPLFAPETAANLRIIAFGLASIILMTLDQRFSQLDGLRNALATVVYPLQYVIQLPIHGWDSVSEHLASRQALLSENQRLKQKQMLLNAQMQRMASLEAENRRLRLLLESSATLDEQVLIAELLTVDFDPYRHQILLNRGTRDGVGRGQPLVDEQGVVGQIVHASTFGASAILITDPNHALPVQVNRNGLRTLAVGTGSFNELDLPHIPNNDDIRVGDLLITSGLGGRFPRGYPVAEVTAVEFDPSRPFARVTAEPTSQLDRIREVLVITSPPTPVTDSTRVGPFKAP